MNNTLVTRTPPTIFSNHFQVVNFAYSILLTYLTVQAS